MDEKSPAAERKFRYSASIPTGNRTKSLQVVSELGLDRLPDSKGKIQLLLSQNDLRRLLERGQPVLLHAIVPVAPLDPKLIHPEEAFKAQLEQRLRNIGRKEKR